MNTVIDSFSVPFRSFSLHILVSLSVAPEIARQVRDAVVFFRQSSRAVRLYESFDRRRVSLRAFIVTEPFVFRELLFIQCPFCCFFEDFSSASCEIGSTADRSFSTVFIFLGKCIIFRLIVSSFIYCRSNSIIYYLFFVCFLLRCISRITYNNVLFIPRSFNMLPGQD